MYEDKKLIYARGVKIKHVAKRCEQNNLRIEKILIKKKLKVFYESC